MRHRSLHRSLQHLPPVRLHNASTHPHSAASCAPHTTCWVVQWLVSKPGQVPPHTCLSWPSGCLSGWASVSAAAAGAALLASAGGSLASAAGACGSNQPAAPTCHPLPCVRRLDKRLLRVLDAVSTAMHSRAGGGSRLPPLQAGLFPWHSTRRQLATCSSVAHLSCSCCSGRCQRDAGKGVGCCRCCWCGCRQGDASKGVAAACISCRWRLISRGRGWCCCCCSCNSSSCTSPDLDDLPLCHGGCICLAPGAWVDLLQASRWSHACFSSGTVNIKHQS